MRILPTTLVRWIGRKLFHHESRSEEESKYDPILGQQPTDLVDQLCTARNEPAANPMQTLQVLLFD